MARYEYKILYGKPMGTILFPWASQKAQDEMGWGSFEKKLNKLAGDGWVVISCSTASAGNFLFHIPMATVMLQRETTETSVRKPT